MKRLLLASSCLFALTVAPLYAQNAADDQPLPQKSGQAPAAKSAVPKQEPARTGESLSEPKAKPAAQDRNAEGTAAPRSDRTAQEKAGEEKPRAKEPEAGAGKTEGQVKRKQETEPQKADQTRATEGQRKAEEKNPATAGEKTPAATKAETRKEQPETNKAVRTESGTSNAERAKQPGTGEKGQNASTDATRNKPETNGTRAADQNRTADPSRAGGAARVEGKVKIDQTRAATLHRDLVQQFGGESVHLNVRIGVGVAVPESVRFRELPPTLVEEYPEFRGYSYFVEDDEVVIVEPRTREVVEVIGGGGRSRVARGEEGDVERGHARFSREQDAVIRRTVTADREIITGGDAHPVLRAPADAELRPLPESIASEMPGADGYGYFVDRERRVVVVDRDTREVVDIVQ